MNSNQREHIDLEALIERMAARLEEQRVFNKITAQEAARYPRHRAGQAARTVRPEGASVFETPEIDGTRRNYSVEEFLEIHDAAFIDFAYATVLGRPPDVEGRHHYLDSLRSLRLEKAEIIARLRYSREGRERGIRIKGLLPRAAFAILIRTPVLGYIAQMINLILRGPTVLRCMRQMDHFILAKAFQLDQRVERLVIADPPENPEIDHAAPIAALQDELMSIQAMIRKLDGQLSHQEAQGTAQRDRIERLFEDLESIKIDVARAMRDLGWAQGVPGLDDPPDVIDELHARLDDKLRGPEAEILERANYYIPYIDECASSGEKILDLGSGRGEWLRLARERGCVAEGIELNAALANASIEAGLDVKHEDIFEYLSSCPENSIGLVSAFHVIEHLPPTLNLNFLRRVLKVLKPGGALILETPNPENLQVGACRFYMDPTHRNPIPPQLLEQLMEVAGFVSIQIHRLHPMPEKQRLSDGSNVAGLLNRHLFGPQDYAAIAYKESTE